MAAKVIFALYALIFIQGTSSQCVRFGEDGCNSCGRSSTGGSFVVTSSSPVAPTGISVISNNQYDGTLAVEGSLPLLGSVAVEGVMGTAGAGAVSYGCGDGAVDIVEEGPIETGITSNGLGYGNGANGLGFGYGNGAYGFGFGCGYGPYRYILGYGNGLYGYGLGYGNGYYGYGSRCGCGGFYW